MERGASNARAGTAPTGTAATACAGGQPGDCGQNGLVENTRYSDDEWWREHYSGLLLDFWRTILPPRQAAEDADFLIAQCDLAPGDAMLDVPCGEGRVAIELAARGMVVTGIDISPGQIAAARAAGIASGIHVDWRQGDMRDLPLGRWTAVACWGDSFGYMDEAGNAGFLRSARQALAPGGRLAMELQMVAEVALPRFQPRIVGTVGDYEVSVSRAYDSAIGRLAVHYELARGDVRETRDASFRIHTCAELAAMLTDAGFRDLRWYARDGSPFVTGSDCLRLVATAAG